MRYAQRKTVLKFLAVINRDAVVHFDNFEQRIAYGTLWTIQLHPPLSAIRATADIGRR
jgi:hypothetical protein